MRRAALVWVAWLMCLAGSLAAQSSGVITGRVVNRDGAGVPRCVVEFTVPKAQKPLFSALSDVRGTFFLKQAKDGEYIVRIVQGKRSYTVPTPVRIQKQRLVPSAIRVPW